MRAARRGLLQAVAASLARQDPFLGQRLHHLFHEEGVALGLLQDESLEGFPLRGRLFAEEGHQQLPGLLLAQRIQPERCVVALAPPAVPVLRPVVDQQQQPRRRCTLAQQVEERLALAVDPVEILEDQHAGLVEGLAQQHALDRLERPLPADLRVHLRERDRFVPDSEQ
jgi:hypothetical protein